MGKYKENALKNGFYSTESDTVGCDGENRLICSIKRYCWAHKNEPSSRVKGKNDMEA